MLPVGGILLAEPFIEPLSGRMVRVGGANIRAGQLLPNGGGYQALLDGKVRDKFEGLGFRQNILFKYLFLRT